MEFFLGLLKKVFWDQLLKPIVDTLASKMGAAISTQVGKAIEKRVAEIIEPLTAADLALPVDAPAVVPHGLRSFDERDANFFLHLLPGAYRGDRLPDDIDFWKTRIEESDPDRTFTVGLIYGPTGCGKSSLVKAGLIPNLNDEVLAVYVEATPADTDQNILAALRKHCPELEPKASIRAALHRKERIPEGKKVLLILDQFEQYLHASSTVDQTKLADALRECDGGRVQCVLLVRDDFITPATRFMKMLQIRLADNENYRLVDLFSKRHAKKVLALFGQGIGALPKPGPFDSRQDAFLNQAISELAEGDYLICVRLALFAEMVKAKDWVPSTLKTVGGVEGVGKAFLNQYLDEKTAPLEIRRHVRATKKVLTVLLPEPGTNIKAAMKSKQELLESADYSRSPEDFEELLKILDTQLHLITPTEAVIVDSVDTPSIAGAPSTKCYKLTHDYLVPSLREWLTEGLADSWHGRAKLRLIERSSLWNAKPETRRLPAWWEYLNIQVFTDGKSWTNRQKKMMRMATAYHAVLFSMLAVVLVLVAWGCFVVADWISQAERLRANILEATPQKLPTLIEQSVPYQIWIIPQFEDMLATLQTEDFNPKQQANAAVTLYHFGRTDLFWPLLKHQGDPTRQSFVIQRLGLSGADPQPVIARLNAEKDPSIRRALILILGTFGKERFESSAHKQFLDIYRKDPDSGIHGATGWLLRRWGQHKEVTAIEKSIANESVQRNDHKWYVSRNGFTMIIVPAGTFQMGASDTDANADKDEKPPHEVTLSKFSISQQEVTQEQYARMKRTNPSRFNDEVRRPVDSVTWFDAVEFCNWLSEEERLKPFYGKQGNTVSVLGGNGYRLPTEAEWEYACRAGTNTPWSCGVDNWSIRVEKSPLNDVAWDFSNSNRMTHPVGEKRPNPWGLDDMHGNLWEWCWNRYREDYNQVESTDGPRTVGEIRVIRGGAFDHPATDLRSTCRNVCLSTERLSNVGFRIARSYP